MGVYEIKTGRTAGELGRNRMSQINSIYKLHKILRDKIIQMLEDPGITQLSIVDAINTEAGKKVLTRSSLYRFVKSR
jgi:hypothetical protein